MLDDPGEELLRIEGVAADARRVPSDDETRLIAIDEVQHLLEAGPVLGRCARQAEIPVNHNDLRGRPPPLPRQICQGKLGSCRPRVLTNLYGGGLAEVDDGQLVEVLRADLRWPWGRRRASSVFLVPGT